jgi:hypothetical protein
LHDAFGENVMGQTAPVKAGPATYSGV